MASCSTSSRFILPLPVLVRRYLSVRNIHTTYTPRSRARRLAISCLRWQEEARPSRTGTYYLVSLTAEVAMLRLLALALIGFAGGWLLVSYLTVEPIKMARALFLATTCLSSRARARAVPLGLGPDAAGAVGIALVGVLAGYLGNAFVVLRRDDGRAVPAPIAPARGIRATGIPRSCTSRMASPRPTTRSAGSTSSASSTTRASRSCRSSHARSSSTRCATRT